MVCQPGAGSRRVCAVRAGCVRRAALLLGRGDSRHGAGRGLRLRGRLCARARRRGAFAGADEPHSGNERPRFRGRGPTGGHHGRPASGGACAGTVLSARSRKPQEQLARGQHRHERGRPQVPQVRRHASLRPRVGSRARGRSNRALRRPDAQEQDGLRPRGPVRGQRGHARRRDGGHAAPAAAAPGARGALVRVRGHRRGGGGGAGGVRGGLAAGGAGNRGSFHAGSRARIHRRGERPRRATPICSSNSTGAKRPCPARSRNCAPCCSGREPSRPKRR